MYVVFLIHVAYAVLMYSFSFRIMVIPHAIVVAISGIYMIFEKGLIIAPILSFIYSFFAIGIARDDNFPWEDDTGNELIWLWVFFCSLLSSIIYEFLY